jgi:ABC-2 type transport system permease protein
MFTNISAVLQKELRSYFSSPVAYIAISMFLLVAGYFFLPVINYREATLEYSLGNVVIILIFLMPLISMRLLSEEKKSGTLELLMTRPIKESEIVIGKYLAAATVLLVMIIPTFIYGIIIFRLGTGVDLLPMITQYGGVFLIGLSFLSLGLFASSLTENQIVSAVISFTFVLIMWLLSWITGSLGADNPIRYFAIQSHFEDLNKGVVDMRDIVFYVSFIFFWLFMSIRVIDSKRWA